jgi:hypothetical protein
VRKKQEERDEQQHRAATRLFSLRGLEQSFQHIENDPLSFRESFATAYDLP